MDNNTQKTENVVNAKEKLLDTQMQDLFKRSKGKWKWISIIASITVWVTVISTVFLIISYYRKWDSFDVALTRAIPEVTRLLIIIGVDDMLTGLSKHLHIGELAKLIETEKIDYRAWLKAHYKQMDPKNQYLNLLSISIDEEIFYAIKRLETGVKNADLIKREVPGLISTIIFGIMLYFAEEFVYIVDFNYPIFMYIVIPIILALCLFDLPGHFWKKAQRRNMVTWVNMIATKLENEDLKGYDKDLYLNQ